MNQPLRRLESRAVVLMKDNVDTDQICPARFLTTTSASGFRDALFADWRFDDRGTPKADFPLNAESARERSILIAGRNFGCGSSREHAVWALRDNGIRAVIASSLADIFRRNALKNGVVPVVVDEKTVAALAAALEPIVIDVERCRVSASGVDAPFALEPFAWLCLLEGLDEMTYLLSHSDAIAAHEAGSVRP